MSVEREARETYGLLERFYDTDRGTTQIVKRRYVMWREADGTRSGYWDFVPAEYPENPSATSGSAATRNE